MRLFIISRVKDEETRKQLEIDPAKEWVCVMSGRREDEYRIRQEYAWLKGHSPIREYWMVCVGPKLADDLDDDIPF